MEDFVTYEQAQRLKALGFDWDCMKGYSHFPGESVRTLNAQEENINGKYSKWCYSAPTLAQAQKWLREVKGVVISVIFKDKNDHHFPNMYYWKEDFLPICKERGPQWRDWFIYGEHPIRDTYEQALSDGITKMLELISYGKI